MVKVYAKKDITYPDSERRPVVRWKKGEVIGDENVASILVNGDPGSVSYEKPELRAKDKTVLERVKEAVAPEAGKKKWA